MTAKRSSGTYTAAQSQGELLAELIAMLQEERQPKPEPWLKSISAMIGALAIVIGAIMFVGSLTSRMNAVEINQSKFVTQDSFNGMSAQLNGMAQRQIEIEKKLDAYILQQQRSK